MTRSLKLGSAYRRSLRILAIHAMWLTTLVLILCIMVGARPTTGFWVQWSAFWISVFAGHFVGYVDGRDDGELDASPIVMTEPEHQMVGPFMTGPYLIKPP